MNYGFVKVAAAVPNIQVAVASIISHKWRRWCVRRPIKAYKSSSSRNCRSQLYLPGLVPTRSSVEQCENALLQLAENTADLPLLAFVGAPLRTDNKLINAGIAIQEGKILGVVPKTYLPNYKSFKRNVGLLRRMTWIMILLRSAIISIRYKSKWSSLQMM